MATNDDDPGFIDDDAPAPKPAPEAAPDGGGVDPFAQGVAADPFTPAAATPDDSAAAEPVPAADPFAGQSPVAGASGLAAEAQAEAEADIKPGSRKDLWACPHCGAKNKPDRDRCRSCDKSPDEPVQRAAWKHPAVFAGAAVVLLVVVLWFVVVGGGVGQVPATPANLDRAPRLAGGGIDGSVGGASFQAEGRLAFCGRVLQIGEREIEGVQVQRLLLIGGDPNVVLADDWRRRVRIDVDDELEVSIDGRVSWDGTVQPVLLQVLDGIGLAGVEPGDLVSCSGSHGHWSAWEPTSDGTRAGEYVIVLDGPVQTASVE